MKSRKTQLTVVIIIFFIAAVYEYLSYTFKHESFFKDPIHAVAIKESDSQINSRMFYLSDGKNIAFMLAVNDTAMRPIDERFMIGDSVSKPDHSYIFKVYRKLTNGSYTMIGEYDYTRPN